MFIYDSAVPSGHKVGIAVFVSCSVLTYANSAFYILIKKKMTVRELIEELGNYDDDAIVEIYKRDDYTDEVKNVYESVLTDFYKVIIIQNY